MDKEQLDAHHKFIVEVVAPAARAYGEKPALGVVEPIKPDNDIATRLEELLERARAGEFSSLFLVGFHAGRTDWFTAEYGVRLDRLRTIGVLESMKLDMLRAMDVNE